MAMPLPDFISPANAGEPWHLYMTDVVGDWVFVRGFCSLGDAAKCIVDVETSHAESVTFQARVDVTGRGDRDGGLHHLEYKGRYATYVLRRLRPLDS